MKQVRLTPQAIKDLEQFEAGTRERIKEALRHLAEDPLDGKPLKGRFQKEKVRSYRVWHISRFSIAHQDRTISTCSPSSIAKMPIDEA